MTKDYTVPAVRRAIDVLEILATSHTGISLADLTRQTGIPKSSLFRILLTLEQRSVVLEDQTRGIYSLGMKLIEWGHRALESIDLKAVAHPHLVHLAQETRESYYLGILDQDDVIIVDRADTPDIWRMVARLGQRSPLHVTAIGQVLMADMPDETVDAIIAQHGLKRFTPSSITSVAKLKKRLRDVKAQGFSVADAEYKPDLCAIAVPIHDYHGRVAASLMTAMQSERARRNRSQVHSLIAILKREAAVISQEIGYVDPREPRPETGPEGRKQWQRLNSAS